MLMAWRDRVGRRDWEFGLKRFGRLWLVEFFGVLHRVQDDGKNKNKNKDKDKNNCNSNYKAKTNTKTKARDKEAASVSPISNEGVIHERG
jgi:hypothetical protein